MLNGLFPHGIPESAVWTDLEQINKVLNCLGTWDSLNHTFMPNGGGLDLEKATESMEEGCIEMRLDGFHHVVKPISLTFVNIQNDLPWGYFMLDTGGLPATGIAEVYKGMEYLCELASGEYVPSSEYERSGQGGKRYHQDCRIVSRYTHGKFLIVAKSSVYNRISSTYDARHNKMTHTEFKDYMISMREGVLEVGL